jgi:hypothetical protein
MGGGGGGDGSDDEFYVLSSDSDDNSFGNEFTFLYKKNSCFFNLLSFFFRFFFHFLIEVLLSLVEVLYLFEKNVNYIFFSYVSMEDISHN